MLEEVQVNPNDDVVSVYSEASTAKTYLKETDKEPQANPNSLSVTFPSLPLYFYII